MFETKALVFVGFEHLNIRICLGFIPVGMLRACFVFRIFDRKSRVFGQALYKLFDTLYEIFGIGTIEI